MSTQTLAVVIPAYNAARTLTRLLQSLAAGDERPDEVIVADDGSEEFAPVAMDSLNLRWLRLDHAGPVAARNAGWRAAAATWIAFVDSDCAVETGWCAAYRRAMDAHPGAGVLEGAVHETYTRGFFRHWAENRHPGRFPTANVAYRREVLEALHGIDPLFQWGRFYFREDSDLALRAMSLGPAVWVGDAIVFHFGRAIGFGRKLREACRYALDPPFFARHGLRALRIDGMSVGPVRIPAPRQCSAAVVVLCWLVAGFWHPGWLLAVAATVLRGIFVLSREGMVAGEAPWVALEQLAEPLVLTAALVAGTLRSWRMRRAEVSSHVV